jgi:hypothetical protein
MQENERDRHHEQESGSNAEQVAQTKGIDIASFPPPDLGSTLDSQIKDTQNTNSPIQMYEGHANHPIHRVESNLELDKRLEKDYLKVAKNASKGKRGTIESRYLKYLNWESKHRKIVHAYMGALKQMNYSLHSKRPYILTTLKNASGNTVIKDLSFDDGLISELKHLLSTNSTYSGGNFKQWLYQIVFLKSDKKFAKNVGDKWLWILKVYLKGNISDGEYILWSDIVNISKGNTTIAKSKHNFDKTLENYIIDTWANYGTNPTHLSNKLVSLDSNLTTAKKSWQRITKSPHSWVASSTINKWYNRKKGKISFLLLGNWIP